MLNAAAHHLEQRLRHLVERVRVRQQNGDAATLTAADNRGDERLEHPGGVVPAAHAILVVADAHQAGILDGVGRAERDVGPRGFGHRRSVEQAVRDEERRRNPRSALGSQEIHRALDQIDGVAAGDFGVRLNIGDEHLHRREVVGDGVAKARREIRGEQARMLRPGPVDDERSGSNLLRHARIHGQPGLAPTENVVDADPSSFDLLDFTGRQARDRRGRCHGCCSGGRRRRWFLRWPAAGRQCRRRPGTALVPSVTFSMMPGGSPTSAQ